MNKKEIILEVEEPSEEYEPGLLEYLAKKTAENIDEYAFKQLIRQNQQLQQKVNQLETNRDDAIEFIQKTQFDCGDFNCCGFGIWKDGKNELLSLLERGKEC